MTDNEQYEYRTRCVEIYIDGEDYVEWDTNLDREVARRPATQEEREAFGEE